MRKLLNELSPELRNRAARKATTDFDTGNVTGLTAAKRKLQASKFLEIPSQLKNSVQRVCDKIQEYFTDMNIYSKEYDKQNYDIGEVKYTIEKYITNYSFDTNIYLRIFVGTTNRFIDIHTYTAIADAITGNIKDIENNFNDLLEKNFTIGTQELPLENNGVSQREIIGMLINLHKKINVELKQSVKQNENIKKSSPKLRTENTIKGITLNEIRRMQQLAGIISLNESSAKINEAKVNKKYTHFIVDKKTNKILNGFDYKGLDNSSIQDYFMEDLKDMGLNKRDVSLSTAKSLMSRNIDPFDKSNWSN